MTDRPFVSVVVPVRNGADTLTDCLTSILASDFPQVGMEIVVVDNGSTDRTAEVAKRFAVRYVTEPRRGLSHARNRAVEAARGEILAFTDADCTVATTWLKELVSGFEERAVSAIAGEMIAFPPSTPVERYVAMRKPSYHAWTEERVPYPWFVFASAAVRRDVFPRIGLFDPTFDGGSEDIDFVWRVLRAGLEIRRCPRAVVFHRHRTSGARLFRQHRGYGRGQAVLARKYPEEIRWSWREEVTAWADLSATAGRAVREYAFGGRDGRRAMRFYFPYYDFIRKLGQRVGFLEQIVRGSTR